ncbi:MAG: S41 family peptidase [Muribaculaceae bacterium]|nr:S41 family peptidase [Muribaculaceae bacterium]
MKKFDKTTTWVPLIIAVTFIGGLWVGKDLLNNANTRESEKKLSTILGLIDSEYVEEVDIDSIVEETIPQLLEKLDPHSTYIPESDLRAVNDELDGSFSGIGISFMLNNDSITVIEVLSGGPSEKVGLLAGDRIVTINDSVVASQGISNEDVMTMLRGEKGTKVKLGIKRSSAKKLLTYEIIRGDIPVTSIDASYIIAPGIGYIKVNKFGRTTYSEFLTSLTRLRNEGAAKYIIDLRGNGGGFLDMAILMTNEFLPARSPIVFTKSRTGREDTHAFSDGTGSFQDNEVAVLIDEYSASASEILAGALQDNDRGLILGRRSFGKGLVQRQVTLPDSSALRLTIAKYYTPSGRCIQKQYTPGKSETYGNEIVERFNHGEAFNADSIKLNTELEYSTLHGRKVYGGGGIMPDIFIPNDTSGITGYYLNVANAGLLHKFSFEYCDQNRDRLSKCKDTAELLAMLPSDEIILDSFVRYAGKNGIPARWYYINLSQGLIINHLKAFIARDILGSQSFYHIYNRRDKSVLSAIENLQSGKAAFPIE